MVISLVEFQLVTLFAELSCLFCCLVHRTPLHCAASCNNLAMVRFLVEHGACIFATTLSDHETAAEKCEEDEEGFDGCSEYLYSRSLHNNMGSYILEGQDVVHSHRVATILKYLFMTIRLCFQ